MFLNSTVFLAQPISGNILVIPYLGKPTAEKVSKTPGGKKTR